MSDAAGPRLGRGEVHVWRAALDGAPASLRRVLAPDEAARAARFRLPRDRARFVAGRGILRLLLGRYLGEPPDAVRIAYTDHGKPHLDGGGALRFNVSHAGGLALYAFARGREVGVDVERVRDDLDWRPLAARFFSPRERAALAALPPEAQRRGFFACWTRKEAYLKGLGSGLSRPLAAFDVSAAPDAPAALLAVRDDPDEAPRWMLRDVPTGPGYVGAVAVEGSAAVTVLDWPPGASAPAPGDR